MTCAHDWVIAQPCPYCRIADLEAENAALRQALQELIALKDIKDSNFGVIKSMTAASESLRLDYERRKPLAWDAARAAMREGKP